MTEPSAEARKEAAAAEKRADWRGKAREQAQAIVHEASVPALSSLHMDRIIDTIARALAAKDARFTAPIVCLCGSVRFRSTWAEQMARLTDEGNIVLSVGRMLPKADGEFDPAHKARLDELHKRKIDLADWVFVLDVGGYIGESTRSEIEYAERIGRPVKYLSDGDAS